MDSKNMVFLGLGVELVAIVLGLFFAGQWLGQKIGFGDLGAVLGPFIGIIVWTIHLLKMAQRVNSESEEEKELQDESKKGNGME